MEHIVWFDLETTGIELTEDRIIEICMIKTDLDGNEVDKYYSLVNPDGKENRPEAVEKHGITMEMLTDAPLFKDIANDVLEFIGDSGLGGYNIQRFDIPLLIEEFFRCNIIFEYRNRPFIDPLIITIKKEPRDLSSLYKRLTGKEMEGAHRAEADVQATIEIFSKQKTLYDLTPDMVELDKEINEERKNTIDYDGKLRIDEIDGKKKIVFNFGKWKDKPFMEVYQKDLDYIKWMIEKANFLSDTKLTLKKLLYKIKNG